LSTAEPLVSAVIPTFRRPELVLRAVFSALAQTLEAIEVIVVVDGGDDATVESLGRIDDDRLRIVVPGRHLGNAGARNAGIAEARSRWIAFLDDDDLWMPGKLAAQLRTAERSSNRHPIVSCCMIGRNELRDFRWPRRFPRPGEVPSEYLFTRSTPFAGDAAVQTSTLFAGRELLQLVPFAPAVRRYVDLDWLLRVSAVDGVGLEFVAEREPLSVWNMEEQARARISNRADGAYAVAWARERRGLFTPRSYAAFLLTLASATAARGGDWSLFLPILAEAWRHGRPNLPELVTHAANFVLPERLKHTAAAGFELVRGCGRRAEARVR
jgi:glycosyltransferase involved in cell wall biosynthesis